MCGCLVLGSSRYGVFTESLQTGLYPESYAEERVPEGMDPAGYNAIVIKGKSADPAVLMIGPEGVMFRDAGRSWGMQTHQTEDAVVKRFAGKNPKVAKASVVVISPAGGNQVCLAVIGSKSVPRRFTRGVM